MIVKSLEFSMYLEVTKTVANIWFNKVYFQQEATYPDFTEIPEIKWNNLPRGRRTNNNLYLVV